MKSHFFNYYKPTDEDMKQLWDEGLYVFDTNVIIKFYRYTDSVKTDFLNALKCKKEHLWVPNQVGFEYQKNRLNVINDQMVAYDNIKKQLDEYLKFDKLSNALENYKYHPYINRDDILKKITDLKAEIESIKKDLDKKRDSHPDLTNNDTIRDEITDLFNNRVGEPFDKDRLKDIYAEGEERYKNNIPPGYKDSGKADSTLIIGEDGEKVIKDKYGDLIIWLEIIEKAKKDKKPVIFVTDDSKEDWWWSFSGKKIGPRPELVYEFKSKTGMLYHMYSAERFLEYLKTNVGLEINQKTIDEVRNVASFDEVVPIDLNRLTAYLHAQFPNRIHSEPNYVQELANELIEENIRSIDDLNNLLNLYPPDQYILPLDEDNIQLADVGVIRSLLFAKKIDEINKIIDGWGPLPEEPDNLRDSIPFTGNKRGTSCLIKLGNRIKIDAANVGKLEISYSELNNRIGMGLPYLRHLMSRLDHFHDLLIRRSEESYRS